MKHEPKKIDLKVNLSVSSYGHQKCRMIIDSLNYIQGTRWRWWW
jgi:hypothetical protein